MIHIEILEPLNKNKKRYAIIRHPYWLCWIFIGIGLVLMSQFWVMILLGIIASVLIYLETYILDKNLIKKFGDDYKHYKNKVTRLNVMYGLIKYALREH